MKNLDVNEILLFSFFSLSCSQNHVFAQNHLSSQTPNSRSRPKETSLSTSMQLLSSSEHLSSGYSSSHTPIPAPDYLMPVSTETMVNGQHCSKFIFISVKFQIILSSSYLKDLLWGYNKSF